MTRYTSILEARADIAEGTMTFQFQKPIDFAFEPGQAIDLVLPGLDTVPDDQDLHHAFSIVSAPSEGHVVIATRMRDSVFKRALKAMPLGTPVTIDGPFGSLGLHNDRTRTGIFIAGGIGVTPFISILRQATNDRLPQRLILLYSNRRPEDAAFLAELQQLEEENTKFRLIATMTEMHASSRLWPNQTGLITEELVSRVIGDHVNPIFYVVGPPRMVSAMRQLLTRIGIGEDDIRSEEFYGY